MVGPQSIAVGASVAAMKDTTDWHQGEYTKEWSPRAKVSEGSFMKGMN